MAQWIIELVEAAGYAGIGLATFIENLIPPIPSEIVMPFSGFAAARGDLTLIGVILAGLAGSIAGAIIFYGLGWWWGPDGIRDFADRRGRWLGLQVQDIDRAHAWFNRYGPAVVFLARLIPGVRSLISIPAGVARMHFGQFLLFSAGGTLIWSALLAVLGYILGDQYRLIAELLGSASTLITIALVLAVGAWVWKRRRDQQTT